MEGIHDVITYARFSDDRLRGSWVVWALGVKVQHFPLTLLVVLTTLTLPCERDDKTYCVSGDREIRLTYINLRSFLTETMHVDLTQAASFLAEHDKWLRLMIADHPSDEDDFWRHVEYVVAQVDGLHDGYSAVASPDLVLIIMF